MIHSCRSCFKNCVLQVAAESYQVNKNDERVGRLINQKDYNYSNKTIPQKWYSCTGALITIN